MTRTTTSAPLFAFAIAIAAAAAPGRHIRYGESNNRLVYAFVFGSRDDCRVIRRPAPPKRPLADFLRRGYGAEFRGLPGDTIVAEFSFGRGGRPLHLVPTNDGRYLLTFANRAIDGSPPAQDRIRFLDKGDLGYAENIVYGKLPADPTPVWPVLERELAEPKPGKLVPPPLTYAFLVEEVSAKRALVARQSEGEGGYLTEMVCFALAVPDGKAELPDPDELQRLLGHGEPLFRAGAAWALGHLGKRESVAPLKGALARGAEPCGRAVIAGAIVACGDASGRKALRAGLAEKSPGARRAAALALARLAPDKADADALAAAVADADGWTAAWAGMALARLGKPGVNALVRASRSSQPATRCAVAGVLGRMDGKEAEARLLTLARDTNDLVQRAAAVALTNPPRAILPENHGEFARALDACRRSRNAKASRRLAMLAAHAKIHHEQVLKALVDLAATQPKAIWALAKLTREKLETAEDCRKWWKSRG